MREIKVWCGTHPEETKTLEVAKSLIKHPVRNVKSGIVNTVAASKRPPARWVDLNMGRAYPGNPRSKLVEERRAPEVLRESQGFFTVIDLHTYPTHTGTDTAYIDVRGVSAEVLGFLQHIGIRQLVLTKHNALHKHLFNAFLLDVGVFSKRSTVSYLRTMFDWLANSPTLPMARASEFQWYKHIGDIDVGRMLPQELPNGMKCFGRLPSGLAKKLGYGNMPIHMLMWGAPNADGYWAEVVTPISPPNDNRWPQ